MIRGVGAAYEKCNFTRKPGKSCDRWGELAVKLEARGYCMLPKGTVGRPGTGPKDEGHCRPVR